MARVIQGDFRVKRTLKVDRRINEGLSKETISSVRQVTLNDYSWLQIINAETQDVVLPDATTLDSGWSITIMADATSAASVNVKTYDDSAPALLKNILVNRAYKITLLDGATDAGVWHVDYLEEADLVPAERYVETFNATSDWGAASGGYYSLIVETSVHARGVAPSFGIFEGAAAPFSEILPDQVQIAANGDITIKVPESPDLRFAGKMIIV